MIITIVLHTRATRQQPDSQQTAARHQPDSDGEIFQGVDLIIRRHLCGHPLVNPPLGRSPVAVWQLSGGCLAAVWWLSGACLVPVWCLSGACRGALLGTFKARDPLLNPPLGELLSGCLLAAVWCLWQLSGGCLAAVWQPSGGFPFRPVPVWCLFGCSVGKLWSAGPPRIKFTSWKVSPWLSGGCLDVWRLPGGCLVALLGSYKSRGNTPSSWSPERHGYQHIYVWDYYILLYTRYITKL